MPPKKSKRGDKAASTSVSHVSESHYRCEWDECLEFLDTMENFIRHVTRHIASYYTTLGAQHTDVFECKWRECGSQVSGNATDFNRHMYFHAFHVKIKHVGARVVEKTGMQGCQLDSQSRNLIPELPERLHCGWVMCEVVYDNPEYFYRHMDMHANNFPDGNHVPGGCRCQWEGCEVTVKSKHRMKEHLRSHTQEKMVACPTCGALFSNRTKFLDHLKRQGNIEVQCYECSHCNKRFTTERLLRDHMRHHVNHYKCPYCDMTCPTPSGLRCHFRYRHTNDRPYKCDQCDYTGKSAHDLRKHMDSHTIVKMYQCHITDCEFRARCYQSLSHHFNKEHQGLEEGKYACHVCNAVFSRGYHLTLHLKRRHKFKWPSGHSRFRYKPHEDGFLRLQTIRYESVELLGQIVDPPPSTENRSEQNQENVAPASSKNNPSSGVQEPIPMEDSDKQTENGSVHEVDSAETVNMAYNLEMLGDVALHGPATHVTEPISNSQLVQCNPLVSLASSGFLPSDLGSYTSISSAVSLPEGQHGFTLSIQGNGETIVTQGHTTYLPLQPVSEYVMLTDESSRFPVDDENSEQGEAGGEADIVKLQRAAAQFGITIVEK